MGLFDRLGLGKRTGDLLTSAMDLGISSPWSEGNLQEIAVSEIFGAEIAARLPMSRADAITIPAVSKLRNLLVATISKFPLRVLDAAGVLAQQPAWMSSSASSVTPYERMAWTVDDLLFHGYSLWYLTREETTGGTPGAILSAEYVPMMDWRITNGYIIVDGHDALTSSDVILFNSPFEGLLNVATATLQGAKDQEAAWIGRARNPIPVIELHVTDEGTLSTDEITELVAAWSKARRNINGAIGYTPAGLELRVHGEVKADLMVEGRNAVRTDIGSFGNVRAAMLDGTASVDSLTYTTKDGERNSFYEFDLPFWTDPIQARLSMDDVVAPGHRTRFDMYEAYNLPAPTGPIVED